MSPKFKKITHLFSILMVLAVLLSACAAPQAPTQAPAATELPAATEAPVATQAPAETQAPAPTEPPAATEAPAVTEAPSAAPTKAPDYPKPGVAGHLVLATTTSTADSGLLDYLLPLFEQEAGVKVDVIAVGSGQAIQLGKDGNADVLLVHSRAAEDAFMAAGDGVRRENVMFNDFIIVGPESDPAGIKGITALEAFKKIAETKSPFISRGDKSGTNTKELSIWKAAGIEPTGEWYISAGQGMGEVLTMAEEQLAYTLSDRATFLTRTKQGLKLVVLVEGDKLLFNPYGVIAVDPKKNSNIQGELAQKFTDWIISLPVQEKIAEFGQADFGRSLFIPDSNPWRVAHGTPTPAPASAAPAATSAPVSAGAGLKVTGSVKTAQSWSTDQIKAMKTMQAESTDKQGQKSTYTGVLIADLLKLAEPNADAKTIVFVGSDGFTAETTLAEALACPNCIIAFLDQGGFSVVMPGFPGKVQVKGVVEIQVK